MSKTKDGESAFPLPAMQAQNGEWQNQTEFGMSLRDWFAGQAIGPLMGSDGFEMQLVKEQIKLDALPQFAAQTAYRIADAMLAERDKEVA